MQFGVVLHVTATYADWDTFLTIAKKAEELGYDSVWVSDHFISPGGRPYGLEAWTVLSALAASTKKIRLGTYVLCNQFRHPSLLAKMASTLDNISKGRLELGIGAGWLEGEHVAFGFGWDKHPTRIERLKEAIEVIKKLWTENHVSYDGKYFKLKEATLEPKPFQKPHPRVWIGGSGCALIAENETLLKKLAEPLIRSMGKSIEESACLIGTPEQCIQKIEQYQKAGAQQIVAGFYDFPSLKGLKLFAKSVIPHFK